MTENDLLGRIDDRIQHLRNLVEKQTEKAFEHREQSDYDGEGEFDDHEKKARTLFSIVHDHQERIHELCRLSNKHEFGEHRLEEAELAGGA